MNKQTQCILCGASSFSFPVVKVRLSGAEVYDLMSCSACQTSFFSPIPSASALAEHYSKDYTFYKGDNFKAQGKGAAFAKKIPFSSSQRKAAGHRLCKRRFLGRRAARLTMGSLWDRYKS